MVKVLTSFISYSQDGHTYGKNSIGCIGGEEHLAQSLL